ncbi:hypothetical protein A1O3_03941 [Capronia epimyces CBS 606.96]|uniref:Uncharacterized protein n=1 Tax=Capronia epimyces CBS 606.96 TaxID=1182542 RepID=W9YXG2_9EURO|nr:uncharacterized protein A1O3_03941 [Capronia epimyces CBS 606.96]EXJ86984.1 hypothetical protein A1O3_03941 [Capronia epimyces CBS 606.96]
MSTTSYQTNAKPRSRRGSHGEASENNRSRASSSASLRLSKTLSRTLDEVAVPRNSRPSSPAIHNYRQRTFDSRPSDQFMTSSRQSTGSVDSVRNVRSRYEEERTRTPGSAVKMKPQVVQSWDDEHSQPNKPMAGENLVTQTATVGAPEAKPMESQTKGPAQTPSSSETPALRLLASMQPTVAEEADENLVHPASSVPPQLTTSPPLPATVAAPSATVTEEKVGEDVAHPSPRTSKSSLQDPSSVYNATGSAASSGNPLLAPHPKSTVTFLQPSLVQQLPESGEGEVSVPIMTSPSLRTEATDPHDSLHRTRSPVTSPTQSPMLQHAGSPPPQHLLYYPLSFMGSPPFHPGMYPSNFTPPNMPLVSGEGVPRSGSAGAEDERTKLLEKVSSVLPDIDRLLHYYRETQGLLTEKDHLVKQAENQHEEEVTRLRIELSATREEYERIIGDQARENVNLKGVVAERDEKVALLEATCNELSSVQEQLADVRQEYECLKEEAGRDKALIEQLVTEKQALEEAVDGLKKQAAEEQALQNRTLAELKAAYEEQLTEKEHEHAKAFAEHKAGLSKVQLDLAGIITKHAEQKKDLDSARAIISEQELLLANKATELADALRLHQDELQARTKAAQEIAEQHLQEIEKSSQELSELKTKHEEEVRLLRDTHEKEVERIEKASETRLAEVEAEHSRREAQLQDEVNTALTELAKEREALDGLKTELSNSQKAHSALASQHEMTRKHHAELAESMRSLKDKQAEWHRESERMDKLLQGFGQLVSSKNTGKSDQFFVSAFNQLGSLIEEIATQFFQPNPNNLAHHQQVYQKLGVPDISGVTAAATVLRSLVIQSQIWSIIQRRVFEPFVFISAHGADDEDNVEKEFWALASMIRAKSLRREAMWRSITMRAIYASAAGRKATRIAATRLSMEIMDRIETLTLSETRPALLQAIRVVAKVAVETWRRARLEWDLIHSSMPSTPETWEATSSPSDAMLWVRPHIVRELAIRGTAGMEVRDETSPQQTPTMACCIYLQGTALHRDSPLVQARRQELSGEQKDN